MRLFLPSPLRFGCLLVAVCLHCFSLQAQSFQAQYLTYLSEVRNGRAPVLPPGLLNDERNMPLLLPLIEQNLADSLTSVRMACYQALYVAQQHAHKMSLKRSILSSQLKGLEDEFPDISRFTILTVSSLSPDLLDEKQRSHLAGLINRNVANKPMLMKMMGSLHVTQATPYLQRLALPGNPSEIRWAAFMALSRMGDENAISYTDHRLRNLSSHMVLGLVPSIIYTRQKQLYDYLVELLYSDNSCTSVGLNQRKPANCAYEILEELAPVIEGFPIRSTSSGTLDTKDYQVALKTARDWFTEHPDYQIVAAGK